MINVQDSFYYINTFNIFTKYVCSTTDLVLLSFNFLEDYYRKHLSIFTLLLAKFFYGCIT